MIIPHDVNQRVAELVRQARAEVGMTQADLAAKTEISRASIANIEIGVQAISIYQLLRLAHALGVAPQRLLPNTTDFASDDDSESRKLYAARAAVLGAK
jgi:transcriptional regulator with XRE-family HTH domain